MKSEMKVKIISRKAIKPASPTPPHLRTFRLSDFDQSIPHVYGHLVFFYLPTTNNSCDIISNISERSSLLQKSLSEILVHFYPMAGQRKNVASIDCNDKGAYFVEARISCKLVDFLRQPDLEFLKCCIPNNDPKTIELALDSILIVQLSTFECGGMAIAICISHSISDATSNWIFAKSWAAMSQETNREILVLPEFIGTSLLPTRDVPPLPPSNFDKCITRRLVFDGSKIASLKSKISVATGQRLPTRGEAVYALIAKCAIAASQSKSSGPSLFLDVVNLRKRIVPPLAENTIGNPIWPYHVIVQEKERELHEISAKMRKEFENFCNEKASKFRGEDGYQVILESLKQRQVLENICINTYCRSSLCNIPFYELDFGWGKPVWAVAGVGAVVKNSIFLMETKYGGGIEAWVTLEEQEMAIFECNEELRAFASFNPSLLSNISANDKAFYLGNSRL